MRGLELAVDESHRTVEDLVAAEREQRAAEGVDRGERAGEAADRRAEIDEGDDQRVLAGEDVAKRRAAGAELGRVVCEALGDDIGREDEEYARRNRGPYNRLRDDALRIAGLFAEGGGAFESNKGENRGQLYGE